jgi:hypothetical protein
VLRTIDGGQTWQDVSPPGSDGLLFRDVEAQSAAKASVLAIGEGDASRIYTTFDGGRHWTTAFVNDDPAAFYDCMASTRAAPRPRAVDPVDGKFRIAATDDWRPQLARAPERGMPPPSAGEFAFAASGTCLVTSGRDAWFATGGGASRVFHSRDGGADLDRVAAPIPAAARRRRVLARVPQPARRRDGRRRLHGAHQRRPRLGLHPRRRHELAAGRRPVRLPLRRRLGHVFARDADRRRADRLGRQRRRPAALGARSTDAARRRRLRAVDSAGRAARTAAVARARR